MTLSRRLPGSPAIAAASEIAPGRYPDHDGFAMQELVMANFLAQWDLDPSLIDGLLISPAGMAVGSGANIFVHEWMTDSLGIKPRYAMTMNAGGATYNLMAMRAATTISSGLADAVLCIGAGKFPKVGAGAGDTMAKMVSDPQFEYPYGSFIPALYALTANRHMHDRGTTREQLASVAVSSRKWALKHPDAIMGHKGPITVDDVVNSRPIASPFNLLDCSVPCEGGAAFLVARGDIAREITDQPAYVLGFGEYHDHGAIALSSDFAAMGAGNAAKPAFAMAGLQPSDVNMAQLYDAFSINPILLLEETGVAKPGEGGRFFEDGRGAPDGDLPVNTYGGLLSFGHTGDASGITMLVEGALQTMGCAGDRQVETDITLVHTYGGMMADQATLLLGRAP